MARHSIRIVHNPLAGRCSTNILVSAVSRHLVAMGHEISLEFTTRPGHASEIAARAAREQVDIVLAAGGDGTVREVAVGLAGSSTALGVIPIGTVNLWASELDIARDAGALALMADRGTIRQADMGTANGHSFLLMASVGFDAEAMMTVGKTAKRRFGRLAYAASALRLLPAFRGARTRLTLDGATNETHALVIILGNTRRYGGPAMATPHALVDDGMLDIAVIHGDRAWQGLAQAGHLLMSSRSPRSHIMRYRARTIEIESERPLPVQVDGDFIGYTPIHVSVRPRILRVLIGNSRVPDIFSDQAGAGHTRVQNVDAMPSMRQTLRQARKSYAGA